MLVDLLTSSRELAGRILCEYPAKTIKEHFGENRIKESTVYGFFGLDKDALFDLLINYTKYPYDILRQDNQTLILANSGDLQDKPSRK